MRIVALVIAQTLYASASALAQGDFPEFSFRGFIDLRAVSTSGAQGWLDRGLGKTRYGGSSDGARTEAHVAEASLVALARLSWPLSAVAHLKFDEDARSAVDVVEAYFRYRPVATSRAGVAVRAGAFFPPVSLENHAIGWTSPYTLTWSAINSWVGEELRTLGVEATRYWKLEDHTIEISGALFGVNDPAGTLLAWRGWALHDRASGLFERLPLAPLRSIEPDGTFFRQPPWAEPFLEIDGRVGVYAAAQWELADTLTARILHYDNRGDVLGFAVKQYAWATRFTSLALELRLPLEVAMIAQYLRGDTKMGLTPDNKFPVDVEFTSYFILLSKKFLARHRVSARYDYFGADDLDAASDDDNNERGHAITLAYIVWPMKKHRVTVELLRVVSDRPERETLGLAPKITETLAQLSYRIFF